MGDCKVEDIVDGKKEIVDQGENLGFCLDLIKPLLRMFVVIWKIYQGLRGCI